MDNSFQKCFNCSSTDTKAYKKIGTHVISFCNQCHLLFTSTISAASDAAVNQEWYSENYISEYIKREDDLKKRFRDKVVEIELVKKGGSLLDLGCGIGLFLESFIESARFTWRLYGVDINDKLVQKAKIRIGRKVSKIYLGRLSTLGLKENSLDCVTCFDVLEHDDQLESTLREIKKILKPSGLLLIQSPNHSSVMAQLCGSFWDWWAVPDHIFHFNASSLSTILKSHGFRVRKLYTWDPPKEFISNIQGSFKNRLRTMSFVGKLVTRLLYIPLLILWSFLVIIEKKLNVGGLLVVFAET